MMYKYILCCALLHGVLHGESDVGPNLLANTPSPYLIDVLKVLRSNTVVRKIGKELYRRNYAYEITFYDTIAGRFDEMPPLANSGYPVIDDGHWLWIPDTEDSETGTWYWLLNELPYMLKIWQGLIPLPGM